jgi:hypothetical protein
VDQRRGGQSLGRAADSSIIGRLPFTDGVVRDVYEDMDGRQWVTGYDGERAYGVSLLRRTRRRSSRAYRREWAMATARRRDCAH